MHRVRGLRSKAAQRVQKQDIVRLNRAVFVFLGLAGAGSDKKRTSLLPSP